MIVLAAWITKMIANSQLRIVKTPLDIPIFLFLLSQFLATIFSQDSHVSLWGYYSRFNGGFLSFLSYAILYYAFVSNFHDISKLKIRKPFSKLTQIGIIVGAMAILFLSVPLAAPSDPTSEGKAYIFFFALLISLTLLIYAFAETFFKRLIMIILTTATVVTIWGLPSHYGTDLTCLLFRGTPSVECWTESFQPTVRIFATLGQPAWLAAYLAFLTPLLIGISINRLSLLKFKFSQLFSVQFGIFFILSLMFYVALLFANTRAGFLAFWAGYVFLVFSVTLLSLKTIKSSLMIFGTFTISLLLMSFFFGVPMFSQIHSYTLPGMMASQQTNNQQVSTQTQEETGTQEEQPQTTAPIVITDSGDIRLNVWKGAIDAFKDNLILGTGTETFAFAYYKYKPASQNLTSEWDFLYNKAHNEYLNYAATTGILGIGTYLLLIGWFLLQVLKWFIQNSWASGPKAYIEDGSLLHKRVLILALVSGYITILITNFFGFSVVIINLFFFFAPAFVFVLNSYLSKQKAFVYPKSAQDSSILTSVQTISIVFVVIIGLYMNLVLLSYWNADKAYALGSNLNRVGDYVRAYPYLETAVKLRGGEPVFKDEFAFTNAAIASGYLLQNDPNQAALFLTEATRLSNEVIEKHPNNVVFWKNRVRMYYLLGQVDTQYFPAALSSIQQADRLAPNDAKISYNHGVILGQMGQIDPAIEILEKTVALKPDFRDAYYALALFYREKATNGTEQVVDNDAQEKAIQTLEYILINIHPNDEQAQESLDSWQ